VEVIDTGIGIAEENIQLVFEEFNRVRTTNKQYEGTGLGLTITKKIVDLLQGKISLKSTPGKGSQFTVVLPLEKGEQLLDIAYRMSKIRSQGVPGDISGTKIWLIDDDPLLLEMTSIILKSAGGEVHSFNEPKRAISSFTKGCADLLITDIQMPEMDGIELLNQIQKKNGEKITAIAISGKIPLQNEYDGFSAFIQKPFQAHTLINVISGQRKGIIKSEIRTNSENTVSKGYNLDQLLAFVEGDQESLNQILVSFIHSGNQNLKLFRQYIEEENISAISELSHKMLSLFRQIEVNELVELLVVLERNDYPQMSKEHFCSIGKSAVEKIETLLQTITKVEKLKMD
jgi:CheY-like chemotaxis protein